MKAEQESAKKSPARDNRADQAIQRAKKRAQMRGVYVTINDLFKFDLAEFMGFLRTASKWLILGTLVGILAGTASAIFLISLARATEIRLENQWLLFFLPLAGFIVGLIYWRFGGTASRGNNLVIDEVNHNQSRIPLRMAPFVLISTVVTHFFGGSAGREGTAIQMGASLADSLQGLLRLNVIDRRLMIMAGIAGGFGSVFGVPAAGFVFGMEVQNVGRIRYEGIIPCMVASFVGDFVTRAWGAHHSPYPMMASAEVDPLLMAKVAIAGIAFGLTSMVFIELIHGIKHLIQRVSTWSPIFPLIGGITLILLTLLVGTTDYIGLSLPLISDSVNGTGVVTFAFLLKLIFTAVTLASGYYGGEVTPLLVIGATLGFTMGRLLGVDPAFMASIGLVSVFAGASNTPLASAIMGIELVGGGSTLYIFLGCTLAYLASGHRGIYITQPLAYPKFFGFKFQEGDNLQAISNRHPGWLSPVTRLSDNFGKRLVRSIMTPQAIFVGEKDSISDIVALALREGIRVLPVLNEQKILVGIIMDSDILRAGLHVNLSFLQQLNPRERSAELEGFQSLTAQDIMTRDVFSVLHTAPIIRALDIMTQHQLRRLPVVDQAGHLMGMITRSDILRELVIQDTPHRDDPQFDWSARLDEVDFEPVYTVNQADNIQLVLQSMLENNCKRLVVLNQGEIAGIITRYDLLNRIETGDRPNLIRILKGDADYSDYQFVQNAGDVMTSPVIAFNTDALIYPVLRSMLENQIKRVPLVDARGDLVGMAGRAGLLRVLLIEHLI